METSQVDNSSFYGIDLQLWVQPSFLDDPDYEEHIMSARRKVSH